MDPDNNTSTSAGPTGKSKLTMEKKDLRIERWLNRFLQDFTSMMATPSKSATAPPSTSTIEPYTSTPTTQIPKEFEWIPATSTHKERKEFKDWVFTAALKAKEEGDDDEFDRLLGWADSVTSTTIAEYPAPEAYGRYRLLWSHSTSGTAVPHLSSWERKRLFKWKRLAEIRAAPYVPKRWSLEEEILELFETAMPWSHKDIQSTLRQEHVIYSCKWCPGLYQCQNASWIWPELIRCSTCEFDDGPKVVGEIVAENIHEESYSVIEGRIIEGRPSTDELGFVTIKLSRRWIVESIHVMLKHGIDIWAPKLTVKNVIVDCPSSDVETHVDWFRLLPIVYTLMSILEYAEVDVTLAHPMHLPESSQWAGILNRWFQCEKRGGYVVIKREVPFILPETDFENAYKDIFALGYGIREQKADWMVCVTPIRQQAYTETCLAAAKLEGWIPNDRNERPRTSYAGYQSCTTEVTENLLDIAKISHAAVLKGEAAKLLGYRDEEVLDCVFRYTSLVNHRLAACVFDDKMFDEKENTFVYLLNTRAQIRRITNHFGEDIVKLKEASREDITVFRLLEKVKGWEKDEEVLGFHLLELTEVLEDCCLSVLPHILCEYLYDLAKKFNRYDSRRPKPRTTTLLLYEATDVVMEKCFNLLGISPGVVNEKFSHGTTLPSSFFESPMTIFRRALLLSTVERPMDVNARDPTRNFRFELFSFRSLPYTHLWNRKGWVFGQISASDKFALRGSVSLFNQDWYNCIRIVDSGLVFTGNPSSGHPVSFSCFIEICLELYVTNKNEVYLVSDQKKDIDLSEFWDKKSEGLCGRLSVGGTDLYYMLLRDAVDTSLEMKFHTKTDYGACEVCGYVVAYYGDNFLYESQSERETISKDSYLALLFQQDTPCVLKDGEMIPLIKSVLGVPTKGSLIVKAYMKDLSSNKVIMNGCFKFKPQLNGFTSDTITGSECSLDLRVNWNYLARYDKTIFDGKEILSCSK